MSEALSQQERLQAIAEKRKKQTEMENKRRQLEDDRRQLQHLKSKALRERWLLDGAPSAGPEEDEARKQLEEDEAKTKSLEEAILRLEQELEELETGVSATSTKENLSEVTKEEETKTPDNKTSAASVKAVKVHNSPRLEKSGDGSEMMRAAMYSVEITIERDRLTGATKVLSTNTLLPKDLSQHGVKVYEDEQKVVHEVVGMDGTIVNGVHQLSSSEVEELIHKADEAMSEASAGGTPKVEVAENVAAQMENDTSKKEITGIEAKGGGEAGSVPVGEASVENPVTMVFMGYQNVEDEDETKKVLGLEGTVKAELVVIEDGESKGATSENKEEQAPPNGSTADPAKAPESAGEKGGEPEKGSAELNNKEKQPCKCCLIM
ncbi:paralemmin 1a isoform X1 [Denticeps clupeoides]|uniref:paralemmin 1a isoform X1 n=1 Tax=Denticeps clupeoides TaxID=299321 RepID=UPI0010A4C10F|nr:paralemmin-1 isoform X1 [Denticeps clupeoides]